MSNNTDDDNNDTTSLTTIVDHVQDRADYSASSCVVYKFRSRPPYEGFILILLIVLITTLFIWWLNSRFTGE